MILFGTMRRSRSVTVTATRTEAAEHADERLDRETEVDEAGHPEQGGDDHGEGAELAHCG